jgi:hypothetical protein
VKQGDLVILNYPVGKREGFYGWHETPDTDVWIQNGTIGMCIEEPTNIGGRICVLINEKPLWVHGEWAEALDETR